MPRPALHMGDDVSKITYVSTPVDTCEMAFLLPTLAMVGINNEQFNI